jgi:hypothetical protein
VVVSRSRDLSKVTFNDDEIGLNKQISTIQKKKKEEGNMKKIICLAAVVLMVVSVAFAAGKMKIAAKDLPGLKGTWTGMLDFGMVGDQVASSNCTLEILNDKVPVQAKLTVLNVADYIAPHLGIPAGRNEFNLDNGQLTSQGTIFWISPEGEKNVFEVSMGREKYLDATYWFRTIRGSALLKKK